MGPRNSTIPIHSYSLFVGDISLRWHYVAEIRRADGERLTLKADFYRFDFFAGRKRWLVYQTRCRSGCCWLACARPDQPFANEILRRLPRDAADFLRQLQDALLNVSRPAKRSRRAKPIRIYEKGIAFRRGGLYR